MSTFIILLIKLKYTNIQQECHPIYPMLSNLFWIAAEYFMTNSLVKKHDPANQTS